MVQIETNIYTIENLTELSCNYRVYQIKGLTPDSDDFHKNIQSLVDKLSRSTKSPCAYYQTQDGIFIAQPDDFSELPPTFDLIRTAVKIEKQPELKELNFSLSDPLTKSLAIRFLKFAIEGFLYKNPNLWRPYPGSPFFDKAKDKKFSSDKIDLYNGFAMRLVHLKDGRIGLCIDIRNKYVSKAPLPYKIQRDEFRRKYKGLKCLYEYGNLWYEIRIDAMSDSTVSEIPHPEGGTLFDDIHKKSGQRKSQILQALPKDCSVLVYYTNGGEQRHVPSGLCRLTYGTEHPDIKPFHQKTLKGPYERRREIQTIVSKYLNSLVFGQNKIVLSQKPLTLNASSFTVPDLGFGNNKVLSVQHNGSATGVPLADFGKKKREYFCSPDAGLFVRKPFDRQYFIIPKSIYETFGRQFILDIKHEIELLNPSGNNTPYEPMIIPYNDSVPKSLYNLGQEIISAVSKNNLDPGFGVVMIPELISKHARKEDELANLVMSRLREKSVYVSVIHDTTVRQSFEHHARSGKDEWMVINEQQRVYKGYVRNVVLNKILLLNSYWPFILKSPLNSDLTIGIDVKNNIAGFTLVYKSGGEIRFFCSESEQREQLSRPHIRTRLLQILGEEREMILARKVKNITIQRQGKLFPSEMNGVIDALNTVAKEKLISEDYQCTFIDVRKTSGVPFRLFELVSMEAQRDFIRNPKIGTYVALSDKEGFICNTGFPFNRKGTTRPLHILKVQGDMSIESILKDIFYLSSLTWTKVDDCSRDPLTVKMNDIRLREIAGDFNKDILEFGEEGGEDE